MNIGAALARIGKRVVGGVWSWSTGSLARRAVLLATLGAAGGFAAFALTANDDRPTRADTPKRGEIQQVRDLPTGSPAQTGQREDDLGSSRTLDDRERETETASKTKPEQPGTGTGTLTQPQTPGVTTATPVSEGDTTDTTTTTTTTDTTTTDTTTTTTTTSSATTTTTPP